MEYFTQPISPDVMRRTFLPTAASFLGNLPKAVALSESMTLIYSGAADKTSTRLTMGNHTVSLM